MKIYIQRITDHYYFAGENSSGKARWHQNRSSGVVFPSTVAALYEEFTDETEIVLTFDGGPAYDLRVAHRPASSQRTVH